MSGGGSIAWFARHELRLAWRDWIAMLSGGRRGREKRVMAMLLCFAVLLHGLAYMLVAHYGEEALRPTKATLVFVTGTGILSFSLMLSQALEMITRVFYARADLDLILSSPASGAKLFAVRICAAALSVSLMALLFAGPFINVVAVTSGPRWLAAYGVIAAMGAVAVAIGLAIIIALFSTVGAKLTRLVAQIVAAVIGAGFVIGIQAAAILSYGSLSRAAVLQSAGVIDGAPGEASILWWPARAIMGDLGALAIVLGAGAALLGLAIGAFSGRSGARALQAAAVGAGSSRRQRPRAFFRQASARQVLRRKELTLLRRDPWLLSQSLMQILYLLPPALLLWRNFGSDIATLTVVTPVVVMAAGQLAGGLAWLTISGEDAPDLVATAPLPRRLVVTAKIEAVLEAVGFAFVPLLLLMAFAAPRSAAVSTFGILAAAASATAIQIWFRAQAKRSHFRRRQTSSRLATIAEAFSSISWAATAALAAVGTWLALVPAAIAVAVLGASRLMSPSGNKAG